MLWNCVNCFGYHVSSLHALRSMYVWKEFDYLSIFKEKIRKQVKTRNMGKSKCRNGHSLNRLLILRIRGRWLKWFALQIWPLHMMVHKKNFVWICSFFIKLIRQPVSSLFHLLNLSWTCYPSFFLPIYSLILTLLSSSTCQILISL